MSALMGQTYRIAGIQCEETSLYHSIISQKDFRLLAQSAELRPYQGMLHTEL